MKHPKRRIPLFFLLLVSMALNSAIATDDGTTVPADLPRPAAGLEPGDVVRIVIGALANNDEPHVDAGIETTFAFASPGNRRNTGPLQRFSSMVKSPPYGIMVNHVESEFSDVRMVAGSAYQLVRLIGRDGRAIVFAFRLSQQIDEPYEGMWMTDAVWPVGEGDAPLQGS